MRRQIVARSLAAVLVALFGAVPAGAQEQDAGAELEDGRWLPYLGCWIDVDELAGPMTCVVPDGPGVALLTVTDGEIADRRVLHAGAGERPVEAAGCTGTESASFSNDGDRVFTQTRLTCGGADRSTRGIIAMVETDRWIEVRALAAEAEGTAWVKRYAPAPATRVDMAGFAGRIPAKTPVMAAARATAARRVSVDDLIEAHSATHPEAVRAWLVEDGEPLRIDADALNRLADAGVDPAVIDVAVAVSFPDRFALDRDPGPVRDGRPVDRYGTLDRYRYDRFGVWGGWGGAFGQYYYDPFYSRYDRYYGYGGLYGPGYITYRPTRIVIVPTTPGYQGGRAVKGRGYTRGSGTAVGPSSRSTGTAGASATSEGQRSGSSGSSKGKAKPRGGGG